MTMSIKSSLACRVSIGALMLSSCIGEPATAPVEHDPARTIGRLVVSPPNAIIAVGGSIQLSVTAYSLTGQEIAVLDSVVFVLGQVVDTLRVRLSGAGLVTGIGTSGVTSPVRVNVFAFTGSVGKADQAIIQVTQNALSNPTLSIQPVAPDSVRIAKGTFKQITPVIRNAAGQSVAGPQLRLSVDSANRLKIAGFESNLRIPGADGPQATFTIPSLGNATNAIYAQAPEGSAWVHASVNAYGTVLRDSVQYTLTWPFAADILAAAAGTGLVISGAIERNRFPTLSPGATVTFRNGLPAGAGASPMTVTFENPTGASAASPPSTVGGSTGDVSTLNIGQASLRRFQSQGEYKYTVTIGGNGFFAGQSRSGVITIK